MELTLVAEPRTLLGSRPSRRLRAAGKVPAVVYGHGTDPRSVQVDARELRHLLAAEGVNAILNLSLDGTKHLALVKDMQRHPLRRTVDHVDFLLVSRDEVLSVDVPVVLEGTAEAVERESGIVNQMLGTLTVSAKPADIPSQISVDISGMQIGELLRVKDLTLPAGATTDADPEDLVAVAEGTAATSGEEGEGEEAAEGGEGGGAAEEG